MNKPLQHFSDEYLEHCRKLSPDEIVLFLEDFRIVMAASEKSESQLISMKVPKLLLGGRYDGIENGSAIPGNLEAAWKPCIPGDEGSDTVSFKRGPPWGAAWLGCCDICRLIDPVRFARDSA